MILDIIIYLLHPSLSKNDTSKVYIWRFYVYFAHVLDQYASNNSHIFTECVWHSGNICGGSQIIFNGCVE